jgi:hypothetical protein
MTVRELIDELKKMPPDAEVYYLDGPHPGRVLAEEVDPVPYLHDDGRVKL